MSPEKIQRSAPWKYLGWLITDAQIRPQKLTLHANISTLHDAQRLFGDLQWVCTTVGITNDDLQPFLPWLHGSDANSPQVCTPEQQEALIWVSEKLQHDSLQTLELKAVCWAFQTWNKEPLNVVSDSLYVVGVVQRIEDALLRRTQNQRLGELFLQLRRVLKQRQHVFCIMHIRSHQCNRDLGEGDALVDAAVSYAVHVLPQNSFERARNIMGVPVEIKTDNSPSYVSKQVATFMQMGAGVKHTTGIPHSSTGQAIVERANRTLKEYLAKQKQSDEIDVFNRLSKVEKNLRS
ncbi:hypothetical protein DV515_00017944 [Chloebia gouldiae]|uniref:Uncharacterized protein n=1 Tax=Chloebia gouldiae TaxID=44316 RepID=A0A3L8Q957_CHLGU|nr:hypothetical protein DV515_00017944 [Chloebia gouldiae]